MTPLQDTLAARLGPILAFDGQFGIWVHSPQPPMVRVYHDLRDILKGFPGVSLAELVSSLPSFSAPRKRKSASVFETDESEEFTDGAECKLE